MRTEKFNSFKIFSHKFNEDGMKDLQLGSSEIPLRDLLSRETGMYSLCCAQYYGS